MSGIAKGVKKVFKKVGSIAKKILPYALPIAAAVFTIGGALGIPAMAGGFGGAMSSLFGNSTLGTILSGAVTQAGYMGLGGMAIGGITGGKKGMLKGSLIGQAAGAVIGGVGGAMSASAASRASAAGAGAAPGMGGQAAAAQGGAQGLQGSTATMQRYGSALPGQVAGPTSMAARGYSGAMVPASAGVAQSQAAAGIGQAAQSLPSAGMTQGMMGSAAPAGASWWAQQDPVVQAAMITSGGIGLGQAVPALFADKDDDNPQLAVEEARRKAIEANYAGFGSAPPAIPALSTTRQPMERWEYDSGLGRVVKKYA